MSVSLSNQFFRYSKPIARTIRVRIPLHPNQVLRYTTETFTDSIAIEDEQRVRVSKDGIIMSNPTTLTGYQDYEVDNNILTMKKQGEYQLLTFDSLGASYFSLGSIKPVDFGDSLPKFKLGLGVPCVPEITSKATRGTAMVSWDRVSIAYHPNFIGDDSFNYRLVNLYGQVSEPACVFVRVYIPNADGSDPNPDDLP